MWQLATKSDIFSHEFKINVRKEFESFVNHLVTKFSIWLTSFPFNWHGDKHCHKSMGTTEEEKWQKDKHAKNWHNKMCDDIWSWQSSTNVLFSWLFDGKGQNGIQKSNGLVGVFSLAQKINDDLKAMLWSNACDNNWCEVCPEAAAFKSHVPHVWKQLPKMWKSDLWRKSWPTHVWQFGF